MGAGVVNLGHEVVTLPIDLVGTTVIGSYQPISYYGQGSQAAQQAGTPWYYISGETAINAGTFGVYGLGKTGYQYYQTGDPTAFQQTTGAFVFTVGVGYYIQMQTSPANNPTYNLGGTGAPGEPVGAINVQPPGAPMPPEPYLIVPSNELPFPPNSGNVVVNNSPISPQAGGTTGPYGPLGPPYVPGQIVSIGGGGNTITITQGTGTPGLPTIGQQSVIAAAPANSVVTITTSGPFTTTITIVTPTPIATVLIPVAPPIIGGAIASPIATTPQ